MHIFVGMDVVIELPCDVMVKAYLERHLPKGDGGLRLSKCHLIGRVILMQLDSKKTSTICTYDRTYTGNVKLVVKHEMMKRASAGIDVRRVREVNELLRQHIRELAFTSCVTTLRSNPSMNIRQYMGHWLEVNGLLEDKVQLNNFLRSFFNWREKHHPEMLRTPGRYHNVKKERANLPIKKTRC